MAKLFLGIDLGSSYTKGCLIDDGLRIKALYSTETGISFERAFKRVRRKLLEIAEAEEEDLKGIVGTGIGRELVGKNPTKTEISCLVKASSFYFPFPCTVVDIGGQDIKIVKIDKRGREVGFKMSRKCAAGTGAFLEDIARRLGIPLKRMNEMAQKADNYIEIGSFCTVFAGTEIIHHLRMGRDPNAIVRGVYHSIVNRVLGMESLEPPYVLTGGIVAHNPVIVEIFKEKIGHDPLVPPNPQAFVAFGAALYAMEDAGSRAFLKEVRDAKEHPEE